MGFFELEDKPPPPPTVPRCGTCKRGRRGETPRTVEGDGRTKILVVAGTPGTDIEEIRKGAARAGISLDKDCWVTPAVQCGKTDPQAVHIEACRPIFLDAVERLHPRIIVLCGTVAVQSLIGYIWKSDPGGIAKWEGFSIPWNEKSCHIFPTYSGTALAEEDHPAFCIRHRKTWKQIADAVKEDFIPRPPEKYDIILDDKEAARRLREIQKQDPGSLAFDYETTGLKPEIEGMEIVSCSVCFEDRDSFAFLWEGEAIDAMSRILKSRKHGKVAANLKFEERWTKTILGHGVGNWKWDTMQAAHVLDPRPGICSIKFQSFVLLGALEYSEGIKPFLKSDGESPLNRIREVPVNMLLEYNALDSIYEYRVAKIQQELIA